ncbi:hypothetical protein Cadr_000008795 [Camelus dromedarius]|uniref:Uncharacterized protein n=1 Tax=Camelus dromedarius TaxID=9838 RepID=A0A5N4DJB5_CAMDR|nr:hypothetical protein Cadr_000008795 [Camelus dromedarius]KAB1271166.1 hypothetical protein Cadr_000008795 [Camelus dromedarius]
MLGLGRDHASRRELMPGNTFAAVFQEWRGPHAEERKLSASVVLATVDVTFCVITASIRIIIKMVFFTKRGFFQYLGGGERGGACSEGQFFSNLLPRLSSPSTPRLPKVPGEPQAKKMLASESSESGVPDNPSASPCLVHNQLKNNTTKTLPLTACNTSAR